ncbi:MAG: hypothetical protein ACT4P6_15210 [Gemmatimonadaceae bacterium]
MRILRATAGLNALIGWMAPACLTLTTPVTAQTEPPFPAPGWMIDVGG